MDFYYKKTDKTSLDPGTMLRQLLTVRRWHRLGLGLMILLLLLLLYKWLAGPTLMPNSAIFCKNRIAEMIWPREANRTAVLSGMVKDVATLENEFYTFLGTQRRQCYFQRHLGPDEEGSWEVCADPQYAFKKPCLIYSFGIGHDFEFEKEAEKMFGCEIHAFDPSMGVDSYQYSDNIFFHNYGLGGKNGYMVGGRWEIRTLKSIMAELGHIEKDIDFLKMDIEFSEWPSLQEMLDSGTVRRVRQLVMEVHTPEMDMLQRPEHQCTWSRWDTLAAMMHILYNLQNTGFEIFYSRPNHRIDFLSGLTGQDRLCCYNLHLVNTKHLSNGWKPPPDIKLKQKHH